MTYASTVLADTPESYWRYEETTGTTAADSAGSNPITWVGAPTLGVTGLISNPADLAVSLGGSPQHGTVAIPSSIPNVAPLTIEFWMKVAAFANAAIVTNSYGSNSGWRAGTGSGAIVSFITGGIKAYNSTKTLSTNTPYYVAIVFDTSFSANFYYNGTFHDTVTGSSNPNAVTGGLAIGSDSFNEYYTGVLDELAIYNYALSSGQISAHYAAASAPAASNSAMLALL